MEGAGGWSVERPKRFVYQASSYLYRYRHHLACIDGAGEAFFYFMTELTARSHALYRPCQMPGQFSQRSRTTICTVRVHL